MSNPKMNYIHYSRISKMFAVLSYIGLDVEMKPMPMFNGYQIICYKPGTNCCKRDDSNNWAFDIICHDGSYGHDNGLLEGSGGPFVTEYDDVTGWLDVQDALDLILNWIGEGNMSASPRT